MSRRVQKGRGAASNKDSRFLEHSRSDIDDGWFRDETDSTTSLATEKTRKILARNNSPDVPFSVSINPYKGCEHGCAYCFARPTHAYLDLSPGLDFETKIFAKPEAATLLKNELQDSRYKPEVIALGANTDPYQPLQLRSFCPSLFMSGAYGSVSPGRASRG